MAATQPPQQKRPRGATVSENANSFSTGSRNLRAWLRNHLEVFVSSLLRMRESLLGHVMTAAVIGLTLSLPAGLYLGIDSLRQLTGDLEITSRISVFLQASANDKDAEALAKRLRPNPDIHQIEVITRAQALEEFRQAEGFREVVGALDDNPLPPLLVVDPAPDTDTALIEALVEDLEALPETDHVILDLAWLQRLQAMIQAGDRLVWSISIILGLGLALVVGNTIRLHIRNRQDEIEIVMMIGGTDAFIRRPFLYTGLWYGLLGGVFGWIILELVLLWLFEPAKLLGLAYQNELLLQGPGLNGLLLMMAAGIAVGLGGAWLVVARYLRRADPT